MKPIFQKTFLFLIGLTLLLEASQLKALTQHKPIAVHKFVKNKNAFKQSLPIKTKNRLIFVKIPEKKIKTRAKKGGLHGKIEALKIYIPHSKSQLKDMANGLAKKGSELKLFDIFNYKLKTALKEHKSKTKTKIVLGIKDLKHIRIAKLREILSKPHYSVSLDGKFLRKNTRERVEFLRQIQNFLPRKQRSILYEKIKRGHDLNLEKDLLPNFARKMARKFLIYRGPNCFHAALAFQGQRLTKSPLYNVKEEKGYHRAMINYDELWRTITSNFHEVNPKIAPLEYGDLLVYFDLPKSASSEYPSTYFRWIRHTATYLVGPYTFSKGSKSASTPYTIKTLDSEWKTWQTFSKNLGVKVFRRNASLVRKKPPMDLTDWLY